MAHATTLCRSVTLMLALAAGTLYAQSSTPAPPTATAAPMPAPTQEEAEDIAFANRLSKAFKTVASKVEPAVIHITALQQVTPVRYDFFGRPVARGQPRLQPAGLGSGVIVSNDGYAVTNNHVIKDADELRVKLSDGSEHAAKLVGRDDLTDLAVLKIERNTDGPEKFPAASWGNSDQLDVGEWVVAIGSPFGLSRTVTAGIVSARGRSITPRETGRTQEDYIQTDAAINPGNSGGPLLNLRGEIIGINTAIASRTGGYEGIGFAIPGNTARAVMDNLVLNGRVVRGWMGVGLEDAKPLQTKGRGSGVSVTQVLPQSPADKAGLKEGDVITKFRGSPVNENRLRTAIAITPPGSTADLEVLRGEEVKTVQVTLADQETAVGNVTIGALGLTVQTLTAAEARRIGYQSPIGARVLKVDPRGRAASANPSPFQEGDIIIGIKGDEVKDADALARIAESLDYNRGVSLQVIRDTEKGQLIVRD
jgi:serine protease Do